jgi:hypothetical protein
MKKAIVKKARLFKTYTRSRSRFKVVVGYIRYFNAKPNVYDPRDYEITITNT